MSSTVSISPVWNGAQFFDNEGKPLAGGQLFQYEAGSFNTEQTTYSDSEGLVANPNPIVLDSSGRLLNDLWLLNGLAYNLVIEDSLNTQLDNIDNVIGVVPSTTTGTATAIWNPASVVPTYVAPNQFLLPADELTNFRIGNRVRSTFPGGEFRYGTVSASSFISPNTFVTIIPDTGDNLDSGIENVDWSANISNGITVDAGAVSYYPAITYPGSNTVGLALQQIQTSLAAGTSTLNSIQLVYTTSGTGTAYSFTPAATISAYSLSATWTVKFHADSSGVPSINIGGLGAVALYAFDSGGGYTTPGIKANQIGEIAFDTAAGVFLLMTPLPIAPATPGRPYVTYVNVGFGVNGIYDLPVNCSGVYMWGTVSGQGSRGGIIGVQMFDVSNNFIGSVNLSATNLTLGPDGQSGMIDGSGSFIPIPSNATYIKCVLISGNPENLSWLVQAYQQFF